MGARCIRNPSARLQNSSACTRWSQGTPCPFPQRPDGCRVQARYRCRTANRWEVGATAGDSLGPLASLIHLAVASDDSERLAAAAADTLARPVAVVGPAGDPLACLPHGPEGERALTVARAAARNGLVAAPAWNIVPIRHGGSLLGHLVIGADGNDDDVQRTVCELLPALLADQLQRVALLRAHRAAFVRRLGSDVRFAPGQAHRDAAELGLALADRYWPALLAWQHAMPPASVVDTV